MPELPLSSGDLALLALLWVVGALCYFLFYTRTGQGSCGLTLAYLVGLFINHWFGAAAYLAPAHPGGDSSTTATGFLEASVGLAGFLAGSLVTMGAARSTRRRKDAPPRLASPLGYVTVGMVSYFVLLPLAGQVPSSTAVVSSGLYFVAAGLTLGAWQAWQVGSRPLLLRWLAGAALLPLMTVLIGGFIGYGAAVLTTLTVSVAAFYRPRWQVILSAILLGYLGLSVFLTYMDARSDIRAAVWGGEGLSARVRVLSDALAGFRLFDPRDRNALYLIDQRMNQNYLVGAAVEYLEAGAASFAQGATLWDSLLAIVPRALWPAKPSSGGSGYLVSDYTGIPFAEGTSVGVGIILELYINFATMGVFIGCAIFGCLVTWFDHAAAGYLRSGDDAGFVAWYVPGLAFQQVGGSLVEVAAGVVGALVAVLLVNTGLRALAKRVR